jgi:hypothetical protein
MPTRSFGLVDYKVREAEYFLDEMKRVGRKFDFSAVQFCASAFVSAARSVTFAMQASLTDHPRFADWYKPKQDALKQDALARFFHEFRTITQHLGENVVSGGSSGPHGPKYYFVPCADLREVPEEDSSTLLQRSLLGLEKQLKMLRRNSASLESGLGLEILKTSHISGRRFGLGLMAAKLKSSLSVGLESTCLVQSPSHPSEVIWVRNRPHAVGSPKVMPTPSAAGQT